MKPLRSNNTTRLTQSHVVAAATLGALLCGLLLLVQREDVSSMFADHATHEASRFSDATLLTQWPKEHRKTVIPKHTVESHAADKTLLGTPSREDTSPHQHQNVPLAVERHQSVPPPVEVHESVADAQAIKLIGQQSEALEMHLRDSQNEMKSHFAAAHHSAVRIAAGQEGIGETPPWADAEEPVAPPVPTVSHTQGAPPVLLEEKSESRHPAVLTASHARFGDVLRPEKWAQDLGLEDAPTPPPPPSPPPVVAAAPAAVSPPALPVSTNEMDREASEKEDVRGFEMTAKVAYNNGQRAIEEKRSIQDKLEARAAAEERGAKQREQNSAKAAAQRSAAVQAMKDEERTEFREKFHAAEAHGLERGTKKVEREIAQKSRDVAQSKARAKLEQEGESMREVAKEQVAEYAAHQEEQRLESYRRQAEELLNKAGRKGQLMAATSSDKPSRNEGSRVSEIKST